MDLLCEGEPDSLLRLFEPAATASALVQGHAARVLAGLPDRLKAGAYGS